jgi:flagellin
LRINTNISALNAWKNLTVTDNLMAKSLEKLSSGYRINRAADDAAGLAISEKMRGQISGLRQATRNAQDGISMIQTAEGALNETHSILQRMRELAVQASTNIITDTDGQAIQDEINSLVDEIDRIADTTQFNNKVLLNGNLAGSANQVNILIGANAGTGQNITFEIASMKSGDLGVGSLSVKTDPGAALDAIENAIANVSTERAKLGAQQNRLEHTINNLNTAAENLAAAESRIRDVDMALEMATFTRHQILLQAGTAMLAQANIRPQSVLHLLS